MRRINVGNFISLRPRHSDFHSHAKLYGINTADPCYLTSNLANKENVRLRRDGEPMDTHIISYYNLFKTLFPASLSRPTSSWTINWKRLSSVEAHKNADPMFVIIWTPKRLWNDDFCARLFYSHPFRSLSSHSALSTLLPVSFCMMQSIISTFNYVQTKREHFSQHLIKIM